MENKNYKIFLSGGGTGGSVTPLLAIYDTLKNENNFEFFWVGTKNGIEKELITNEGLPYITIPSGKLRRYFSWRNFTDIFLIIAAFFKSFFILSKYKPKLFVSAGSFVSVPMAWAAWVLRIPVLIHQQDIRPGLANQLMAPVATKITVTFEASLKNYGPKAEWTGNPIRPKIKDDINIETTKKSFDINSAKPVLLVVGGGTGAEALNNLLAKNLDKLLATCEIIHVYGKNKMEEITRAGYHPFALLQNEEMIKALKIADLVVSRCGLGFLTELAALKKAAILIPMPNSHQEDNAQIFADKEAAIVLDENKISEEIFADNIFKLFSDDNKKENLKNKIGKVMKENATENIIKIIKEII